MVESALPVENLKILWTRKNHVLIIITIEIKLRNLLDFLQTDVGNEQIMKWVQVNTVCKHETQAQGTNKKKGLITIYFF